MRQTRRVVTRPARVVSRRERIVERRNDSLGGPVYAGPVAQEVTPNMGIGVSVFLLAVGAILRFAVEVHTQGVNLHTIGVILMVVGLIGLTISALFWSSFAPFGTRDREVVTEREVVEPGHTHIR